MAQLAADQTQHECQQLYFRATSVFDMDENTVTFSFIDGKFDATDQVILYRDDAGVHAKSTNTMNRHTVSQTTNSDFEHVAVMDNVYPEVGQAPYQFDIRENGEHVTITVNVETVSNKVRANGEERIDGQIIINDTSTVHIGALEFTIIL